MLSGKNNYLIVSTTMQRGIFTSICAFFFLFEKNIAEKYLDGKVGLLLTFLFQEWLQLKDSDIKVSFGFSAPLGDNFWNKHKGCAQQPPQKLVSKKYN